MLDIFDPKMSLRNSYKFPSPRHLRERVDSHISATHILNTDVHHDVLPPSRLEHQEVKRLSTSIKNMLEGDSVLICLSMKASR